MEPSKHIPCHLVVLAGLTPQVITEALFVLSVREGRHVAHISVLTSPEGADTVQNALLLTHDTPLERFCRDYGIQRSRLLFGLEDLHRLWPRREVGGALQPASLDGVMERLATWCSEGELPIIACVAGGRKDMVVLLTQIFALLARPEDRLVHLLTSPHFENLAEFFYPPPQPATLAVHRAGGVMFLNSAEAQVEMMEIPLVRLRSLVDEETRRGLVSLEMAQQRIQREVESLNPSLRIFPRKLAVWYHGGETVLPPKEFAVLLFFAQARKEGWGAGRDGWIPGRELDSQPYVEQLEQNYHTATVGNAPFREVGFIPRGRDGQVNFEELKQKMTHAISKIKFRLGEVHPARVQSRPARGGKEYGLLLDPQHIHIDEA
ncbi:CRISPR-associated protein Csx14 [Gammaproteobacteria bacterium]